jgi:pyruvate/2-oxoglutarate dehydrogenase complex dihydrolipoamide dehydrogenase (E3) component
MKKYDLVKILVDADTEQFLGATIFGVGGDEIINMFTTFMYTKQSFKLCYFAKRCWPIPPWPN